MTFKKLTLLALTLVSLTATSIGQELKKADPSSSAIQQEKIEKLRTEYQNPLSENKFEISNDFTLSPIGSSSTQEDELRSDNSKSMELSLVAYKQYLDGLNQKKTNQIAQEATPSKPDRSELKSQTENKKVAVIDELNDNAVLKLKESIHQQNIQKQQRIVEIMNGGSSEPSASIESKEKTVKKSPSVAKQINSTKTQGQLVEDRIRIQQIQQLEKRQDAIEKAKKAFQTTKSQVQSFRSNSVSKGQQIKGNSDLTIPNSQSKSISRVPLEESNSISIATSGRNSSVSRVTSEYRPKTTSSFQAPTQPNRASSSPPRDLNQSAPLLEVPSGTTYDTLDHNGTPTILIVDGGNGIGTNTFTTDYVYALSGLCYVNEGQTLTINPGAVIKGWSFQLEPSMLIVAVGGTLVANGTAANPIVFTSESDLLAPPASAANLSVNLDEFESGLWGGVAILGDYTLNGALGDFEFLGQEANLPLDVRLEYGGGDAIFGNPGTSLTYTSIRYTGEFNGVSGVGDMPGLTLAGVGSEAVFNHIEVLGAAANAYNFLGGNADASHLIAYNVGNNGFETDFGYTGKMQFLLAEGVFNTFGEHHGGYPADQVTGGAFIYNATYLGDDEAGFQRGASFDRNASGHYYNSIFSDLGTGVVIEYSDTSATSYDAFSAGDLFISENIINNVAFGDYISVSDISDLGYSLDPYLELGVSGNILDDPLLDTVYIPSNSYTFGFLNTGDLFYEVTDYAGAFAPASTPWYADWAFISGVSGSGGSVPEPTSPAPNRIEDPATVISIFNDLYDNIATVDLNPDWGQATVQSFTDLGGDNTMKLESFNYQGIDFGGSQDLSGMESLRVNMWTENASVVQVFLISSGFETGISLNIIPNSWETYEIPLSEFTGVDLTDVIQIKFDDGGAADSPTIFLDNIMFYTLNPAAPALSQLPFDFEVNPAVDDIIPFEGAAFFQTSNPLIAGIDTSAQVGQMNKDTLSEFAGALINLQSPIDFVSNNVFKVKVLTPNVGTRLLLKVENSGDQGVFFELENTTTLSNEWEELTFDFSPINTGFDYDRVVMVFDLGVLGDGSANFTYYVDDLVLDGFIEPYSPVSALPFDFEINPVVEDIQNFDGGDLQLVSNPLQSGINVSTQVGRLIKGPGEIFAGSSVNLDFPIDFVSNNVFRIKVNAPAISTGVFLKVDNRDNPSDFYELESFTTTANEWEELTFDFSGIDTGLDFNRISFVFDLGTIGDGSAAFTYYLDDLFLDGFIEPYSPVSALPFDFEISPDSLDFEDFSGAQLSIIDNPQIGGINTSNKVGQVVKGLGDTWAGSIIYLADPIDFSINTTFNLKVFAPAVGTGVIFKVENSGNAGIFLEQELFTTTANEWEVMSFDFSSIDTAQDYDMVVMIFDNGTAGDGSAAFTYLLDDIELVEGSGIDIDLSDYTSLVALRNSLGGDLSFNWLDENPPSTWPDIDYDGNGRVTALYLDQHNLSGDIPVELTSLTQLGFLTIGGNTITSFPEGMGNLDNVGQIYAWANQLTSLPSDMFDMASLFNLDLGDNQLTEGSFGAVGESMFSMKSLLLGSNQLNSIPSTIYGLSSLTQLNIDGNPISFISSDIANLTMLESLNVGFCNLTDLSNVIGSVPSLRNLYAYANNISSLPDLSSNRSLRELRLWDNQITNNISDFFVLDSLEVLDVYNNQVSGTLDGISNMNSIREFYVGVNLITGGLPIEISGLTELSDFRIHDNQLSGELPAELFELPQIANIELQGNGLSGAFPTTSGSNSIYRIDLANNFLSSISPSIGNFPNLQRISFFDNDIIGSLPVELSADTALLEIQLQFNEFTGGIPAEWASLLNLEEIYLTGNFLDQPLPEELGAWTMLQNFAIDQNSIPGDIPASYSNWLNLENLYIYTNELTGLPDWSQLAFLIDAYVYENNFRFDDLEKLVPSVQGVFGIDSQNPEPDSFELVNSGENFIINAEIGGTYNHYTWFLDGNYLEVADTSHLVIEDFNRSKAGTYTCTITNDSINAFTYLEIGSGLRTYWITAEVAETDSLALIEIYNATSGYQWVDANNWLITPVAMWEGVIIEGGRVTELDLSNKNLIGAIPPAVGELTALKRISLWNNPEVRNIAGEFYGLSNLTYIDFDNAGLTKLSPSINLLTNLDTLWLGDNPFRGNIPKELYDLTSLKVLHVRSTTFSGAVTDDLSKLINLEWLSFSGSTDLTSLPNVFDQLPNLKNLNISNMDGVSGSLPSTISTLSNLETLNLSNTPFDGGLEQIAPLTNLVRLYLYGSPMAYTSLPSELSSLVNIETLGLGFSDYSAGIPDVIWNFTKMKVFQMPECNVNGPLPTEFNSWDSLSFLNLRTNGFTGALPSDMNVEFLERVYLMDNSLNDISVLEGAPNLFQLFADGNQLDFEDILPFKSSIENGLINIGVANQQPTNGDYTYIQLSSNESITLSMNVNPDTLTTIDWFQNGNYVGSGKDLNLEFVINPDFDGQYEAFAYHNELSPLLGMQLNSGIFDVQVVESIDVADSNALVSFYDNIDNAADVLWNWKEGPVENWTGVIANGGRVYGLALNGLQGEIPGDAIASLTALEFLQLSDGELTGEIPPQMFTESLFHLDLGRNQLSGSIPTEINNSPFLNFVGLAGNRLTGSIPDLTLPDLYQLYLDRNGLSGAVPDWLNQIAWGGLSLDRNKLDALPEGLDTALVNAFYVNFEYNAFDIYDLIRGSGNSVGADATTGVQSVTSEISFTGDAAIGGSVTLSATRTHPDDEFTWFRYNKFDQSETPVYEYLEYTGTDSTYFINIDDDFVQTNYLAAVTNPNYKFGGYEFLTHSIAVDPFEKRYTTSMTASPRPEYAKGSDQGAVGLPDLPPNGWEWFETTNYWENPIVPDTDTLKLIYEDSPIPINYVRLYGASPLAIYQMTLRGDGGESIVFDLNFYINHWQQQIVFPKTTFAVSQVDLAVREGAIDAFEIGDTGAGIEPPVLDDRYTSIGEDFLYIEIRDSNPLADYLVLESSTDGTNFVLADTLYREGWHYRQVPPGKYYYRAKEGFSDFDFVTDYSNILETGNCEPTFPSDKLWAGSSLAIGGGFAGQAGTREEVTITPIGYAEFSVSDVTAGWYDPFFGFYEDPVNLLQKCDVFYGFVQGGQSQDVAFTYENDTLYAEWWDYANDVQAISKFWVTGDAPVSDAFDPGIPTNLNTRLIASASIEVNWDQSHPDAHYIVQRSVANSTQYVNVDTVSTNSFIDSNNLDNQLYFYRVRAMGGDVLNQPSNEACIVHKQAIFDPISNVVTNDITRTSYGGSWGDFDGDGDDDLYVVNAFEQSANFLYENTGNGTFRKVIGSVATSQEAFTRSAAWGDYDNDGFLDLLVPTRDLGDIVYRNTGSKSFEKRGAAITAATASIPSESGIWVDLNQDGRLDMVNSNGLVFTNNGSGAFTLTAQLENGDGVLAELPILIWTVSNVDIDNDGDQDIYFTSDQANMLFINDGTGNLGYVSNEISNPDLLSRGFSWADFNNDGYIDLLTGDRNTELFGIYLNMGNGSFEFFGSEEFVISSNTPVSELFVGRGYSTADLNNDGNIDIIGTLNSRARILYNNGNAEFTMVEEDAQAFPLTSNFSHISLADINGDGAMDIFLPNQDFNGQNFMYLNNGNSNTWLSIRLKGIESNRSGIGARVKVKANNIWQSQTIRSLNGISSGNSLTAEFGLGTATLVDSVEVSWPSGKTTYALNVVPNKLLSMVEIPEATGPTVNAGDSTALVKLYENNGGVNWTRQQGWLVGSPLGWEGVDFDESGRLVALILNDNNLSDTITAEITTLTALKVLDLSGNNLEGPLPSALGNLTALENLSLNDNQLDGTIPSSVGSLVNLQNLDLYSNNFFGELPRTLGGLVNLNQFEIQDNGFIGFVPAEIGTLSNLSILRLDNNDFEGALPNGLGGMESLQVLYVNDNNFTEGLPAGLGSLSTLLELKAQNNEFFGPLPTELSNLKELQYVDISNNMFTGSIAPLALAPFTYYFNADNNRFDKLPDLTTSTSDSILVRNNAIDFGFFELNDRKIRDGRLFLSPQGPLFDPVDSLHGVGDGIEIAFEVGGSFNSYQWKFNGSNLESSTGIEITDAIVFVSDPDTPNQGEYILEITNSNYTGVILTTNPFTLKLSSLERDKQALLAFMEAVNKGEFPVALNWSEPSTLSSDWDGVTVTGDRVTALVLPAVIDTDLTDGNQSQIFDGQVPLSFTDLSGLVTLDLRDHFLRSFPNISNWPSIEAVNISNNRLAFKDLIPNIALGSKLTYIPQRRYDVTLNDVVQAGDDKIVRINMSGTGLQYQWKFGPYLAGKAFNNNVTNIEGANSRVYQIENLGFDQMGTYRVDITHPSVPGLTITSRNRNILATTDIFGKAFADDQNTLLTDGFVGLYRKTPSGPFVFEDSVGLDGGGEYAFRNVVLGDFVVLTKPDRTIFPNTVDTYYEKADLYENATTLEVRNRVSGIDIEMVFYEEPDPVSTGADFDGLVESDFTDTLTVDEEGGRVNSRRKVKKAGCSMRRFVISGRPEEDVYELYAYIESDDEGRFTFTDIAEGKYRLNIEYPGVPMDPDSEIEFVVGGDKENQQFTLVATITEDGISVDAEEVLYTYKPYIKDVKLYPNPTNDVMIAEFLVYRKLNDLKMEILDVRGVQLFEINLEHRMGAQSAKVDLTDYRSGVYFIVFTDEAGTFRQQLKIGKK